MFATARRFNTTATAGCPPRVVQLPSSSVVVIDEGPRSGCVSNRQKSDSPQVEFRVLAVYAFRMCVPTAVLGFRSYSIYTCPHTSPNRSIVFTAIIILLPAPGSHKYNIVFAFNIVMRLRCDVYTPFVVLATRDYNTARAYASRNLLMFNLCSYVLHFVSSVRVII